MNRNNTEPDRLAELREKLHHCDEVIVDALLMRGRIIEDIMLYKEEHGLPIMQPDQEARQDAWIRKRLEGERHQEEVLDIFHCIRQNSKKIQARRLFDYNIFLIGFMGAGKTTLSDYMHTLFAMDIVEMDEVIAGREGMSVSDIFAMHGEKYFRKVESELLSEMQMRTNTLISCGGGVPLIAANVETMKKSGRIVLLTATPETILDWVRGDHTRPLLEKDKSVGFISTLMEKRREQYEAAADLVVCTDGKTTLEICNDMIDGLLALDRE